MGIAADILFPMGFVQNIKKKTPSFTVLIH